MPRCERVHKSDDCLEPIQHRHGPRLDCEHHDRPAGDDDGEGGGEGGQRHRLRQQDADHRGNGLRQVIEAQEIQRIAADDERDEDEAADHGDRDKGLE